MPGRASTVSLAAEGNPINSEKQLDTYTGNTSDTRKHKVLTYPSGCSSWPCCHTHTPVKVAGIIYTMFKWLWEYELLTVATFTSALVFLEMIPTTAKSLQGLLWKNDGGWARSSPFRQRCEFPRLLTSTLAQICQRDKTIIQIETKKKLKWLVNWETAVKGFCSYNCS